MLVTLFSLLLSFSLHAIQPHEGGGGTICQNDSGRWISFGLYTDYETSEESILRHPLSNIFYFKGIQVQALQYDQNGKINFIKMLPNAMIRKLPSKFSAYGVDSRFSKVFANLITLFEFATIQEEPLPALRLPPSVAIFEYSCRKPQAVFLANSEGGLLISLNSLAKLDALNVEFTLHHELLRFYQQILNPFLYDDYLVMLSRSFFSLSEDGLSLGEHGSIERAILSEEKELLEILKNMPKSEHLRLKKKYQMFPRDKSVFKSLLKYEIVFGNAETIRTLMRKHVSL